MNTSTNQSWTEEYDNGIMYSQEKTGWLNELNSVTQFDPRNEGHTSLTIAVEKNDTAAKNTKRSESEEKLTAVGVTKPMFTMRFTDVRETDKLREKEQAMAGVNTSKIVTKGRGRRNGHTAVSNGEDGITGMIARTVGTAHRLHHGERKKNDRKENPSRELSKRKKCIWEPCENCDEHEGDPLCEAFTRKNRIAD